MERLLQKMDFVSAEDLEDVRQALTNTGQNAQKAQKFIREACIFLNAKQAIFRRFETESVKAKAVSEIQRLQAQLQAAQGDLNPMKNVRQDFAQRTAAAKLV